MWLVASVQSSEQLLHRDGMATSAFSCVRQGLRTHVQDGAVFVADAVADLHQGAAGEAGYYDLAFIDTFDGLDDMPASLFGDGELVFLRCHEAWSRAVYLIHAACAWLAGCLAVHDHLASLSL